MPILQKPRLDEGVYFVEMDNPVSYHSSMAPLLYYDITGRMPHHRVSLENLSAKMRRSFSPQNARSLEKFRIGSKAGPSLPDEQLRRRRGHMPGLIFQK
jgi:hypothetical protein